MIDTMAFRNEALEYAHSFQGRSVDQSRSFVDPFAPFTRSLRSVHDVTDGKEKDFASVDESDLVLCAPTVFGYAFKENGFVQMTVDGISDIDWDVYAYKELALAGKIKSLLKLLVRKCRQDGKVAKSVGAEYSPRNIISNKGTGMVFVLHGEPGTGKTLTAEAIAEELRAPLMPVSVSDLGTDPTEIERRFTSILSIAHIWDAIVLLDEADIFVQARTNIDIFSNAVVGALLKVLATPDSPIFLTTNRVSDFDDAILSRVTLEIEYMPLGRRERRIVWKRFLDFAKLRYNDNDLSKCREFKLNGR